MRVILSFLLSIVGLVFQAAHATDPPVILILGDSLSAGFGMDVEDSWVHLLEIRLQEKGHSYRILNSSVSGDTTQGGLTRLPRLLDRYQPEIVIIELGGNDGLRGINPDVTRKNMTLMIQKSRQSGAQVLLAGINDSADTLAALSQALFDVGVMPYYLHLLDRVSGAAHFDVPEPRALAIHRQLLGRCSGYLVPRLVRESPDQPSKIPLAPYS